MTEDGSHIRAALLAGAAGYSLKSAGRDELEKALSVIIAGQPYISNSVLQERYRQPHRRSPRRTDLANGA